MKKFLSLHRIQTRDYKLDRLLNSKVLMLLVSLICLLILSKIYLNHAFSLHFVDEEDNFLVGYYLTQGEKIYRDLFFQHQPLAVIFSAGIQLIHPAGSIFSLVKEHRMFMIFWSVVWSLFLIFRFRWKMLPFIITFELIKYYLLGYLFLAESLVAYPLAYLVGTVLNNEELSNPEKILMGIGFSLVVFQLAPLWPLVIFLVIWMIYKERHNLTRAYFYLAGFLPLTFISWHFSPIRDYFFDTIFINNKYYLPIASHDPLIITLTHALLAPWSSLFVTSAATPSLIMIRLATILLSISLAGLVLKGCYRYVAVGLIILALSDIRYVRPGMEFYQGFHLLPWLTCLLLLTFFSIWKAADLYVKGRYKLPLKLGACGLMIVVALTASFKDLFVKIDQSRAFYINYSRQSDISAAIKATSSRRDNLFVAPDESLVYWQSKVSPASPMFFYYAWMDQAPPLRRDVKTMFEKSPPTFVYLNAFGTGFEKYLSNYRAVKKDNNQTGLYVKNERLGSLSKDQFDSLSYYHFTF